MLPDVEKHLTRLFYKLGRRIGQNPIWTLSLIAIGTLVLFGGLIKLEQSTDIRDFVPSDAESRYETKVAERFARVDKGSFYSIQIVGYAKDGGSLLRTNHSEQLQSFLDTAMDLSVEKDGETFTYKSNCRPYCEVNSPLSAFLQVFPVMEEPFHYPQALVYGTPLYIGNNIFEVTTDNSTGAITGFGLAVIRFLVIVEKPKIVMAWEEKVRELYKDYDLLDLILWSDGLLAEEIDRLGYSTAPLIGLSVLLLITFFLLTSMRADSVRSKPWEALIGILVPVIAIGASFGVLAMCGIKMQPIIVATLFLVLSVGTDDAFIMMRAWDRTIDHRRGPPPASLGSTASHCSTSTSSSLEEVPSIAERTAEMLAESGSSIAITTLTNMLSFGVGIFSSTPAIRALCIYSTSAIFACFVYQITFYTAIIALSGRRESKRLSSILCCVKAGKNKSPDSPIIKAIFRFANLAHDAFFDLIINISKSAPFKITLCFIMIAYWAGSCYSLTFLRSDLTVNKLALPDSMLIKFQERLEKAQSEMQILSIFVTKPADLRKEENRMRAKRMVKEFEHAMFSYGKNSTLFWLADYEEYVTMMSDDEFTYTELPSFLDTPGYTHWKAFVHIHEKECAKNTPKCVDSFLLNTGFTSVVRFYERVPQLENWRKIASKYAEMGVVPFNENSLFTDQSSSIAFTVESSLLAALAFMAVSCLLFIPSLSLVFFAIVSIASVNIGVFGVLVLCGVELDPLSMAAMLMSVGFSVDYTAHITYHFYKSEELAAEGKLRFALSAIGWPMIQCALSTILAVSPLLLKPSYIAHVFFETVVFVIFIGVFHGLVFIPALLLSLPQDCTGKQTPSTCSTRSSKCGDAPEKPAILPSLSSSSLRDPEVPIKL
ncbi:hypothetical protein PENTCL1PPCAC_5577 [Pristionchus entomophagus]|uniref:SSD domain-containing protein n=1 Tax=Pristionchus entomophagus TaxID=358040 RepID=A0AAV5SLD0_9BILA|nr:hypothetical protein PENTCL1PPCAC_5577 [Pristionchus entomophagus]